MVFSAMVYLASQNFVGLPELPVLGDEPCLGNRLLRQRLAEEAHDGILRRICGTFRGRVRRP
jgi:hypothetical protein